MIALPYKIGLLVLCIFCTSCLGYLAGRQQGREAALKAALAAYQMRGQINDKVQNLDPVALCRALGGVPDECAALMRGVDAPAAN